MRGGYLQQLTPSRHRYRESADVHYVAKPLPLLINMSSGPTESDTKDTGSEGGKMVIQAPFIIAPTHKAAAASKESASGAEASSGERGEGPLPLVMSGPSGAGRLTFCNPCPWQTTCFISMFLIIRKVHTDQETDGSV